MGVCGARVAVIWKPAPSCYLKNIARTKVLFSQPQDGILDALAMIGIAFHFERGRDLCGGYRLMDSAKPQGYGVERAFGREPREERIVA